MDTKAIKKTLNKIYKSYLFTVAAKQMRELAEKDYRKMVARQLRHMEMDKKHLLRRAGLTTYSPVRSTVGSSLLFLGGAAAGALIGLSLAPMRGHEFRRELKGRATEMMGGHEEHGQASARA